MCLRNNLCNDIVISLRFIKKCRLPTYAISHSLLRPFCPLASAIFPMPSTITFCYISRSKCEPRPLYEELVALQLRIKMRTATSLWRTALYRPKSKCEPRPLYNLFTVALFWKHGFGKSELRMPSDPVGASVPLSTCFTSHGSSSTIFHSSVHST